ncbi:tetratricopeptide repeat protein 36 [Leptidea sinapis]|uniref:tetratricopeptide repeat protein 36 n=1 Tax=Leptidea sinapis TaxID=189913 RepID=UPI00213BA81C|nr:tetratricopeptide repeat protein 36 [Leptidea sinapis]
MSELSDRDRAVLRSIFDPTATIADVVDDGDKFCDDDDAENSPSFEESKALCVQGVKLAEEGKLEDALELMSTAVLAAPERAGAYNDRAQLLRLMARDDDAMADIDRAVELSTGTRSRSRALALCQQGVLLRKRGADEDARRAFSEAAALGSSYARKQVVEMNPYAALCNQMLSQVMKGENIKL